MASMYLFAFASLYTQIPGELVPTLSCCLDASGNKLKRGSVENDFISIVLQVSMVPMV